MLQCVSDNGERTIVTVVRMLIKVNLYCIAIIPTLRSMNTRISAVSGSSRLRFSLTMSPQALNSLSDSALEAWMTRCFLATSARTGYRCRLAAHHDRVDSDCSDNSDYNKGRP